MNALLRRSHPWYALIIVMGVLFVISSFSYMMLMLRAAGGAQTAPVVRETHSLMRFMEAHGPQVLAAEIVVLGLATAGAIWQDRRRRRQRPRLQESEKSDR